MRSVTQTRLPGLECLHRGKVRDLYRVDDEHLLLVATDRFSAFDVVFEQAIPGKGIVLTQLSLFWFQELADVASHHVVAHDMSDMPKVVQGQRDDLGGRTLLVRHVRIEPFECIVRGRLLGSAWSDYQKAGRIAEIELEPDLTIGAPFEPPIFTPSTKAPPGAHDEPVTFEHLSQALGPARAAELRDKSLAIFERGVARAKEADLVLCDTKLEWGESGGELILADEVLTCDSSRYWREEDLAAAASGTSPPSYDKQVVRDWLLGTDWNRQAPGPTIPDEVLATARARYVQIHERLTGRTVPHLSD